MSNCTCNKKYFKNYNPNGCCIEDKQTDQRISDITINARSSDLVLALKTKLQNRYGFHINQQHLYFNNEPLANNYTLGHYGVKLGSVLRLIYGVNDYQFCDVFLN